jgi:hypothetical protein
MDLCKELVQFLNEKEERFLRTCIDCRGGTERSFHYHVLTRPELTFEEKKIVVKFASALDNDESATTNDIFNKVLSDIGLSRTDVIMKKSGNLYKNLLIILLLQLRRDNCSCINLKYPSKQDFMDAYPEVRGYDLSYCRGSDSICDYGEETTKLWHTANTAAILFVAIPSHRNFTLAMQVVPKVVEGWAALYATGGGQMQVCSDGYCRCRPYYVSYFIFLPIVPSN